MVVYKATIVNLLGEKQKFTVIGNRITEILNAIEKQYPLWEIAKMEFVTKVDFIIIQLIFLKIFDIIFIQERDKYYWKLLQVLSYKPAPAGKSSG